MSESFKVQDIDREITFTVKPAEAAVAFEWFKEAARLINAAQGPDGEEGYVPKPIPMIVNELVGGFSAIAENRGYGGS